MKVLLNRHQLHRQEAGKDLEEILEKSDPFEVDEIQGKEETNVMFHTGREWMQPAIC